MRLIYLRSDGTARVEKAKVNANMIEMPDGYHPLTNDSVWQDAKRKSEPVIFIIQGVLGPYGSSMANEDVKNRLYEIEVVERAFKPQSVSKMWQRKLQAIADFMGRAIPFLLPFALLGLALYWSG